MNRLAKISVLTATFFTIAFSPLAQVSAAPFQEFPQNYSYGQGTYGDVEQIRHKGRHHYKKHRKYRHHRYCHYTRGGCRDAYRPHHRHRHHHHHRHRHHW